MAILVTGGAGYIGSHTAIELLNQGFEVIIIDNLSNSSKKAIFAIEEISGKRVKFYQYDLLNKKEVTQVFTDNAIDAVVHFGGFKAVGESVFKPLEYYQNNLNSTMVLLEVMRQFNCIKIVFSSSATVYGDPTDEFIPIPEHCPTWPTNPYGRTKWMIEFILKDLSHATDLNAIVLRYFNPAGAHPSGKIGESPKGIPNNLMPFLAEVAVGKRSELKVFGNNYPTRDGTGIRDYIHVVDLAKGHLAALKYLNTSHTVKYHVFNLGTGTGSSVLEMVAAMSKAVGRDLPYSITEPRAGDVRDLTAVPTKANKELNWKTEFNTEDACRDLWRWISNNPNGFE